MNAWGLLLLAGLCEVGWVVGMKYTDGFSRLWPSAVTVVLMTASVWFLALAQKSLPLGTSYAVWTGIGAAGAAVAGVVLFAEPVTALRLASIALIIAGVLGLKLAG